MPPLKHLPSEPPQPTHRLLRGYAFDPSLATQLETALVSEITYKVPWENLTPRRDAAEIERETGKRRGGKKSRTRATLPGPGPRGEYIEVVDYDPASGCFYAPVNLDRPEILAQNGLPPSESDPQFHQQMVYAVAMTTIDRFERALGRKAFWAGRWEDIAGTRGKAFVKQLRIYPHALRQANAYYSRKKRALLFGYFPATSDRTSGQFPGGIVFTCLSHDVIAHETTHALLDGFHEHFMDATNADVLAFHEAFADIVALFQHFTFPEVLRHQIAKTRGNLGSENLLGQMATQFGHARGIRGALRDAIGKYDPKLQKWVEHKADPTELDRTWEVHERGAILVAAVFDAFLSIYRFRTRDLVRLASGGTGELEGGELHPDLVNRLAQDAAKSAAHVLNICIRALDYCPPVDLTFGEYLRALITADMDLMPEDRHNYRVAFVEAFRRRGIYPENIRVLSESSLRWSRPEEDPDIPTDHITAQLRPLLEDLRGFVDRLRHKKERQEIWQELQTIRTDVHSTINRYVEKARAMQKLTGLALHGYAPTRGVKLNREGAPRFEVHAFREARREREDGRILNQAFITILQSQQVEFEGEKMSFRCGSTLVLDLDESCVSYVIRKGLNDTQRMRRTRDFQEKDHAASLTETYFGRQDEPFAALHVHGAR
ncbi:MAG TPA: hypothetical protein VJU77_04305 [Chthoniobacterales bacterium]|nr:hypothetical protein [Chthoniobacterales bacterium]